MPPARDQALSPGILVQHAKQYSNSDPLPPICLVPNYGTFKACADLCFGACQSSSQLHWILAEFTNHLVISSIS